MSALEWILLVIAVVLVLLAYKKSRIFGSKPDEIERRHPSSPFEEEDSLVQRRKDDSVGGEGG